MEWVSGWTDLTETSGADNDSLRLNSCNAADGHVSQTHQLLLHSGPPPQKKPQKKQKKPLPLTGEENQ